MTSTFGGGGGDDDDEGKVAIGGGEKNKIPKENLFEKKV